MGIFAGNLSTQISIELRSRGLLIPWVKRATTINFCSASHSSGPVRYIPKHSQSKGNRTVPLMKSSEQKRIDGTLDSGSLKSGVLEDKRVTKEIQSSVDRSQSQFFRAKTSSGAETDHAFLEESEQLNGAFHISNENESCETNAACTNKSKQDAESTAIEALSTRAFTAVELQKKLHGKKFPLDIIGTIITDFQERGLINDYLYAESFSRSRWSSLSWGPRRIKQALVRKGVSEAVVEKALKQVFEDGDSGGDQDTSLGMSKVSMDHLFAQALKQWLRGQDVSLETRKSRIVRWLQYRGFNWGVTNFILKKLQSQYLP
ncbi:regulatory protein RecX family protein [Tasmannia lanceolata]|uniref:regulatory protein RecX family protein n=1 Tax=Tasmannia lanceolata TaxID=3420 RepID=UPI0040633CC5